MYVILVYDVTDKKVTKMLNLCRRYLNWIQNSVFEGEISEVKLQELLTKAKLFMDNEKDSIIIFKSRQLKWLEKQVIGKEKNELDTFL
ncbi:CRISPR-associated endonuclease Cas2 [Sphingobacterium sp. Mn56C]|uniref:CRISPR-associated endonuclease Cas2 n=1 Tax=Sphingobacterium sp. Mn56C TaxID=3395261 RepID=UPI003BD8EFF2